MRRPAPPWLAGAAACALALAPSVPAAPAADAAHRAAAILASAKALSRVSGQAREGVRTLAWRGYFSGEDLRLVEETVTEGGRRASHARYYFADGGLFYYTAERAAAPASGATGAAPEVPVRAEFRGALTVAAVRIEHFGEVRLEPAEVEAIRRRAGELASAARLEHNARRVAP